MVKIVQYWNRISIRYKVLIWAAAVCAVTMVVLSFSSAVQEDVLDAYARLMDNNVICYEFQESLETERNAFVAYIRENSQENLTRYREACDTTYAAMEGLPFDYEIIGRERYARTGNIRNG